VVCLDGCLVGPSFQQPDASLEEGWLESGHPSVRTDADVPPRWWEVFGDPVMVQLVETAYAENLPLRSAGLRVVQAQTRRAITIGTLYPQRQQLTASYAHDIQSDNTQAGRAGERAFNGWQTGFDAAWEIDLWGRFRRSIEASDADLLAAVASYDDVLVSLLAEVASTYLTIRTLDERLAVAVDNVRVQQESLDIARVRFEAGGTSELDVEQAATLLHDTEASIPQLELLRRNSIDSLCVLLGVPPQDLPAALVGTPGRIPAVPAEVTVGIPADLLRRRPDVHAAELRAAAQSARIGVASAELLPAFQLVGSLGLSADSAKKLFEGRSFELVAGPAVTWPILNYGRLINDVRLQDATFQDFATQYSDTVLLAQQEVEDALAGYVRGTERVRSLQAAVDAANRAVELSLIQYREGATDFVTVLNSQQSKLREDDQLVNERGLLAIRVVSLYRALGGGWEIREGQDFVPAETRDQMRERTRWGGVLSQDAQTRDTEESASDLEKRPWWKPRWWWPRW
jgi:NodT family efflux transporter outer membrane factor (OMF) lipoprotein